MIYRKINLILTKKKKIVLNKENLQNLSLKFKIILLLNKENLQNVSLKFKNHTPTFKENQHQKVIWREGGQ